jgi:hypothetical protein
MVVSAVEIYRIVVDLLDVGELQWGHDFSAVEISE